MNISDKAISWLRTVVPGAWGIFLAWAIGYVALPDPVVSYLTNPFAVSVVVALVIGLWKGVFNWIEPKMPAWLTRILLGSNQTPTYGTPVVDGSEPDLEDIDGELFDEAAPAEGE